MNEYSPKRRTALVFAGSGTTGAYHAGALKALDESGVKIDLVVGSGVGVIAAAYAAVMGGSKLYGEGGFWSHVRRRSLYRLRPTVRLVLALLGITLGVLALPVLAGLVLGVLFPVVLVADRAVPGLASRCVALLSVAPELLSGPFLVALAVPVFALALLALLGPGLAYFRDRRRFAETFESVFDARPGLRRLQKGLATVAAGAALRDRPGGRELGRRYVSVLTENLGEPGFRDLVLRTADLDAGEALSFFVLRDSAAPAPGVRAGALAHAVDLRLPGNDSLVFDALATGLLSPFAMPLRRVAFPRGTRYSGETHRLTDATFVAGAGIAEATAAGAEQVILVAGAPEHPAPLGRRRGPLARIDASMRLLEAQALRELEERERLNRIVSTLGHRTQRGRGAWQDPITGEVHQEIDVWVIRPQQRALGPMEWGGARDPATEVVQTIDDLVELGFRDTYRLFVEPIVGQSPLPEREEGKYRDVQPMGL